jgi:hypothetical protein
MLKCMYLSRHVRGVSVSSPVRWFAAKPAPAPAAAAKKPGAAAAAQAVGPLTAPPLIVRKPSQQQLTKRAEEQEEVLKPVRVAPRGSLQPLDG